MPKPTALGWPYPWEKCRTLQDKLGFELQGRGPPLSTCFDPLPEGAFGARIRRSVSGGSRGTLFEWPGTTGTRGNLSTVGCSTGLEGCDFQTT